MEQWINCRNHCLWKMYPRKLRITHRLRLTTCNHFGKPPSSLPDTIRSTVSSRVALRAAKGVSRDASTGSAQAWATPAFAEASVGRQHDTLITGRFDRVEELPDGTLRIIDFKTSRIRNQSAVDQDLQLSVYALAGREELKKEVSQLTMLFLVDESLTEVVTRRGEGELNTAAKTIELLSERVLSGDYTPTPSKEKCRGCPYRRICDASASP